VGELSHLSGLLAGSCPRDPAHGAIASDPVSIRLIALTDDEWDIVVDTLVADAAGFMRLSLQGAAEIIQRTADKIEEQHDRQRQPVGPDPAGQAATPPWRG
jgi:hypothetical protein